MAVVKNPVSSEVKSVSEWMKNLYESNIILPEGAFCLLWERDTGLHYISEKKQNNKTV